ncbi:hypothetical protein DAI22_01g383901 [Oryza sativa Japonica Group]|nr:hypothetical protein DAI22_01g383901 [Oryza sativa Japonica Group]
MERRRPGRQKREAAGRKRERERERERDDGGRWHGVVRRRWKQWETAAKRRATTAMQRRRLKWRRRCLLRGCHDAPPVCAAMAWQRCVAGASRRGRQHRDCRISAAAAAEETAGEEEEEDRVRRGTTERGEQPRHGSHRGRLRVTGGGGRGARRRRFPG